ncbi:unnamed protein product [Ceratitis capitata]|uniref:(Mediterranean fruit fly) hypothetical protein n=1 Tax=Ceratitis capitata TaxID=7213 RepID=A0A811V366_CERCA|nr:unnamed protein product [Ceratitis capitata]
MAHGEKTVYARQYLLTSAGEEEKDKILAKWLGVEIDGAYFYDWATGGGEHAASMVAAAAIEHTEESEVSTEGISTGSLKRHWITAFQ